MSKSTKHRRFVIRPDYLNDGYFEVFDIRENRVATTVRGFTEANRRARHLNANPPTPALLPGYIDTVCINCAAAILVHATMNPPLCAACERALTEDMDEAEKAMELCHAEWLDEPVELDPTPEERADIEATIAAMEKEAKECEPEPPYIRVPVNCID